MSHTDPSFVVFSEILPAEEEEEHDWLVKVASRLWGTPGKDPIEDWPLQAEELLSVDFDDVYGNMPKWKPLKRKKGILIYSDDGCSMHAVTPLIQLYFKRHHSNWYWWCEWAEISEAPHPGGFRGGAVFITEQHVAWHVTTRWVNSMLERMELQHR